MVGLVAHQALARIRRLQVVAEASGQMLGLVRVKPTAAQAEQEVALTPMGYMPMVAQA
jgi:hypothetical protein